MKSAARKNYQATGTLSCYKSGMELFVYVNSIKAENRRLDEKVDKN